MSRTFFHLSSLGLLPLLLQLLLFLGGQGPILLLLLLFGLLNLFDPHLGLLFQESLDLGLLLLLQLSGFDWEEGERSRCGY